MNELLGSRAAAWFALVAYAVVLYRVAPRAHTHRGFFWAEDVGQASPSFALLTGSVLVSWIFAKSITNAANLGEKFGLVGGLAYAGWYLSVPVAGLLIYRIRRHGHEGLIPFLVDRFGPGAAFVFSAAILIRLFNEVWSNTAVVGGYFGPSGSGPYYLAALAFTGGVLLYTLRGGLRSSIFTDRLQLFLAIGLLAAVLGWVLPSHPIGDFTAGSSFTLAGGLDLLLVALLQTTSYPFHDPVLTDRAFITPPRRMVLAYALAGILGVLAICLYSLIGVYARLEGLSGPGDAPVRVAAALQGAALCVVSVLMMNSAGACLDSAFAAVARHASVDLAGQGGAHPTAFPGLLAPFHRLAKGDGGLRFGRATMIAFAIAGNLPLFLGADILQATTLSGTMVLGLAPPFVFGLWHRRSAMAFYLSFATGLAIGICVAVDAWPTTLHIGEGSYAPLLGANLCGLIVCVFAYGLGLLVTGLRDRKDRRLPGQPFGKVPQFPLD